MFVAGFKDTHKSRTYALKNVIDFKIKRKLRQIIYCHVYNIKYGI